MSAKKVSTVRTVPMTEWGKDHWSVLAYVETRCVDHSGMIDPIRMRCNSKRHPGLDTYRTEVPDHNENGTFKYPSMLAAGKTEPEHDDWDCFYDLEAAGLVEDIGTGIQPIARMRDAGRKMVAKIRAWKASGGTFGTFQFTV